MMPDIPHEITEPTQRNAFRAVHYWDKYDFRDTAFLTNDGFAERSHVDYLELLSSVSEDVRIRAVESLMKKAGERKETFLFFSKLNERYLYNPDSPVCDDEIYGLFLREELKSPLLGEAEKIRPLFLLESVMKNRTGHAAEDFTFTLVDGLTGTLHGVEADFTLLYFNDPECEECRLMTEKLTASPVINRLLGQAKLKVLAVYPHDNTEAWIEHASFVPSSWIYARDAGMKIEPEGLYNIKRFPTIYLLDRDKKVLLKDTTFETLDNYFNKQPLYL
jgi:hypothetical protein